jgi:hypothetical protein
LRLSTIGTIARISGLACRISWEPTRRRGRRSGPIRQAVDRQRAGDCLSIGRRGIRTSDFRKVRVGHPAENRASQALARSSVRMSRRAESRCAAHRAQTARPQVHIAVTARIPKRVRYSVTGAGFRDNRTEAPLRDSNRSVPRWGDIWRLELLVATSRCGLPLLAENARAVLRGFPSISQEGRHEAGRTTESR